MRERVRVSGGRRRHGMVAAVPVLRVFQRRRGDARYRAVATGRLCQVLRVVDQARLIAELTALRRALQGRAPLDPYPHAAVGRRCRVTAGPFRGTGGNRRSVRRQDAASCSQVGILGRGAAMEIHAGPAASRRDDNELRRSLSAAV